MIIRADKAFFEAMREAGYDLDFLKLAVIYGAAKAKRKANPRADTKTCDLFGASDNPESLK